ncbi:carboxymuconolactone decarboxylase family protein [Candidatus Bathyarchaeota archaeon]|nr:carboxymuconolactone decarboxylase family protein [Candidatus Bathyarchaeota archaeon]
MFLLKYLDPIKPSKASELVGDVYSQIKQDFGRIVEPFTLHSPIPPLLASVWMASRESELVGKVSRRDKETIAATVSNLNKCPYCVDAHTILIMATGEKRIAQLIAKEQYENIIPEQKQKIVKWALSTLSPESNIIKHPPFSKKMAPEFIGTTVFYHYINPLVIIFLGKTPIPIPFFRSQIKPIASRLFQKAINRPKKPGASLSFLPSNDLPKDFSWVKESNNISGAYARLAGVIDELEKTIIPQKTIETIKKNINPLPEKIQKFGNEWLEKVTKNMTKKTKITTILALLTIFSPYKITKEIIKEFQSYYPKQEQLLGIVAWASFTKARKIGKLIS